MHDVNDERARTRARRNTRSDKLLAALRDHAEVLVITHDNPDPDAVAASWGIATLVQRVLKVKTRVVAGGAVVRAENLRMLEVLAPPLELVEQVEPADNTGLVMVDCAPSADNHLLGGSPLKPTAVIDHHPRTKTRFRVKFRDVRPQLASTATIVGQYLREQKQEPSVDLATALVYGIQTDAHGRADFSRTDQRVLSWLNNFASHKKLADIESAPISREYYADLLLAMESAFVYDDTVLCFLPQASGPEIVGEVADLLIRGEGIERVLCGAGIEAGIAVSVRTTEAGGDASVLLAKTLKGLGHSGGHAQRAGGKIPTENPTERVSEDLQSEIRTRWLAACGVSSQRGTRLVARREIIKNL